MNVLDIFGRSYRIPTTSSIVHTYFHVKTINQIRVRFLFVILCCYIGTVILWTVQISGAGIGQVSSLNVSLVCSICFFFNCNDREKDILVRRSALYDCAIVFHNNQIQGRRFGRFSTAMILYVQQ